MKNLIMIMLLSVMCLTLPGAELQAQGLYVPDSDGYELADTTRQVKIIGNFDGQSTDVKVGVYFTSGAAEDADSKVQIFHALDRDILTAGYGHQISVDSLLTYANDAEIEYLEQTITVSGGVHYLGIKIVPVATATDTFNIKPLVYVKP